MSVFNTVKDLPHTVHGSNTCWYFAVPTSAHTKFSIHSTCF